MSREINNMISNGVHSFIFWRSLCSAREWKIASIPRSGIFCAKNWNKNLFLFITSLWRTASFPKKLFLGISPRRLILPPNSLLAAPAGAASKPLLPPTKNHEVQFGALCLKMREPFLNETVERNQTKEASPATARQARYTTEKYSLLFSFCARRIFSSKRKRKLFCWVLLWTSRAAGLRFGRRAKIPSPRPPSFLPACWIARFADVAALGNRKKVNVLDPSSHSRAFEILLPWILTFIAFRNIIEI